VVDAIVRAIVHLNFSEPDKARDVLILALADFNFAEIQSKEIADGNAVA
jgi:hypothetical protein